MKNTKMLRYRHTPLRVFLVLITLTTSLFNLPHAYAENGSLDIDSNVISEEENQGNNTGHERIGYQLVPDLFLKQKQEREKTLRQRTEEKITQAKQENFSENRNKNTSTLDTRKIRDKLFTGHENKKTGTQTSEYSVPVSLPAWLVGLFWAAMLALAGGAGFFLSKKYASLLIKKEKT